MKKYKLGYLTGVFDLLHIGHLRTLRSASEQCQKLIVGVCSDELVQAYRGEAPVMPLAARLAVVAAIRYVDVAIVQEAAQLPPLWEEAPFDVVFCGEDQKNSALHQAVEQPLLEAGCQRVQLQSAGKTASALLEQYLEHKK